MSLGARERTLWKQGWTMTVKLMTSQVVKGTWLRTGVLWRLKGVQKVRSIAFNNKVRTNELLDLKMTAHLVLSINHHRQLLLLFF